MNIAAIICEYNPFHNGHEYHIRRVREITKCDAVICVMSGSFMQRGDVAICDKWTRTASALHCGADVVFELPCAYSDASAQFFALGGVSIACGLGADILAFGAESDISLLRHTAHVKTTDIYKNTFEASLAKHNSYPIAEEEALNAAMTAYYEQPVKQRVQPNDILAVEYIASVDRLGANIKLCAVERLGARHDEICDTTLHSMVSAAQIRARLADDKSINEETARMLPPTSCGILQSWLESGERFVSLSDLDIAVVTRLRSINDSELSRIPFADGGFAQFIYDGACKYNTINDIVKHCTSKHCTSARVRRALIAALVGIDKDMCKMPARYTKLLGFRRDKAEVVAEIERRASISIIKKTARDKARLPEDVRHMLELDIKAQDVYSALLKTKSRSKAGRDYTEPIVIV